MRFVIRAKVFSPPKKTLASADTHASDKRQQFSARMLPAERRQSSVHPLKHLRICVPDDGPQVGIFHSLRGNLLHNLDITCLSFANC